MAWIEFHTQLRDHWKIERLKDALNIPYTQALGIMGCLWTWAAEQAQNGDLSRFTDAEISRAGRWEGRWEGIKSVLKQCGLLDDKERINDWHKHGLRVLKSSRKRQIQYRKSLHNGNVTQTPPLRPSILSIPSILSNTNNPLPPLSEPQEKLKTFLTTSPPLNAIPDVDLFVRRATVVYKPEDIEAMGRKVIEWCAKHPEWEKKPGRNWGKTLLNWLSRDSKGEETKLLLKEAMKNKVKFDV